MHVAPQAASYPPASLRPWVVLSAVLGLLMFAGFSPAVYAQGTTIPINNAGFEQPATTTFTNDAVTGWTGTSNTTNAFGVQNDDTYHLFPSVPEGAQYAYIESSSLFQDLSAAFTAGTTYTLQAYVGSYHPGGTAALSESINLYTTNGSVVATSGSLTPTAGAFTLETLAFTPTAADQSLGQNIRVLVTGAGGQTGDYTCFDKVTLTQSIAAPEPSSYTAFGLGTLALMILARRRKPSLRA